MRKLHGSMPAAGNLFQNEKAHIEDDLCEECGFCVAECPVEAISLPFPMYGK